MLLETQLKNPKNLISGEMIQSSKLPERKNLINENKTLVLGKSLNAIVLGCIEKELDWSQQ